MLWHTQKHVYKRMRAHTHTHTHTHTLFLSLSLQADMHTYMYAHMAGGVCVQKSLKKRKVVIWLAKLS